MSLPLITSTFEVPGSALSAVRMFATTSFCETPESALTSIAWNCPAVPSNRVAVDGANAARDFLRGRGIADSDIEKVWLAIALHTTPGIPKHMHPVVALLTAGVEMDVLGWAYDEYSNAERAAVVEAFPRTPHFKEDIIQAFYEGMKHRPDTTFGTVNDDVLADKDPHFHRGNFCSVIRGSHWHG